MSLAHAQHVFEMRRGNAFGGVCLCVCVSICNAVQLLKALT